MKIITNAETNVVLAALDSENVVIEDGVIKTPAVHYADPSAYHIFEITNLPEDFQTRQTCYTAEGGFYPAPAPAPTTEQLLEDALALLEETEVL